jgi:hypothetical protein
MQIRTLSLLLCTLALAIAPLRGQDSESGRRYSFGVRVDFLESKSFSLSTVTSTVTKPAADYSTTSTSDSSRLDGGITSEVRVWRKFTLGLEAYYHPVQYNQVVSVKAGVAPASGTTDTRVASTYTEATRANYWDFPLLVRYRGIRNSGIFSHVYPLGGIEARYAGNVRTSNTTQLSNGTNSYNEIAAHPAHRTIIGGVVGIGMRFVDPVGLKIMPEIRFIKWQSPTFQGTSYRSLTNQLEAGVGLNF